MCRFDRSLPWISAACSCTVHPGAERPQRLRASTRRLLAREIPDPGLPKPRSERCRSIRFGCRRGSSIGDPMSDRDEPLVVEDAATAERLTIPDEMPVLPLRDTVLFPNSFMPLAVARESSVKLIDEAIAGGKLIGVFTQRDPTQRRAGPGRPLSDRHADPHPQDVQAAGRQPAADRPGPRPRSGSSESSQTSRTCAPQSAEAGRAAARRGPPRDRRAPAQHPRELPAGRVSCRRVLSEDLQALWRPTSPIRAGWPTSSPRA